MTDFPSSDHRTRLFKYASSRILCIAERRRRRIYRYISFEFGSRKCRINDTYMYTSIAIALVLYYSIDMYVCHHHAGANRKVIESRKFLRSRGRAWLVSPENLSRPSSLWSSSLRLRALLSSMLVLLVTRWWHLDAKTKSNSNKHAHIMRRGFVKHLCVYGTDTQGYPQCIRRALSLSRWLCGCSKTSCIRCMDKSATARANVAICCASVLPGNNWPESFAAVNAHRAHVCASNVCV